MTNKGVNVFFIPLFDDNTPKNTPFITWFIFAVCIGVFLWQQSLAHHTYIMTLREYGVVPHFLLQQGQLFTAAGLTSIVTSMFLHGGWLHLIFNMLYLWVFSDNIEDAMGPVKFVVFYLLCGFFAALSQALIAPSSTVPMIGASGGLAGILGAYLLIYPRAAIRVLMIILIFIRFISLPAWLVLGVWIAGQFVSAPASLDGQGGVAYFAHIGGFIAGMALAPFFIHKDISLFGNGNPDTAKRWSTTPIGFDQLKTEAQHRYQKGRKSSVPQFRRKNGPWDR